jgi:hypothetical protein
VLALLTIPVILYQLFFVLAQYVARRFGNKTANVVLVICLVWTAFHIFMPLLAVVQTVVILGSYFAFRPKASEPAQESKSDGQDAGFPPSRE